VPFVARRERGSAAREIRARWRSGGHQGTIDHCMVEQSPVDGATGSVSADSTAEPRPGAPSPPIARDSARVRLGTAFARRDEVHARPTRMEFARLAAIRAAQFRSVAPGWMRKRPWMAVPMFSYTLTVLWASGYPRGRVLGVAACYAISLLHQVLGSRRKDSCAVDERSLFFSHLVMFPTLLGVVALTGGLGSPLVPGLVAMPLGMMIVYGRSREANITLAVAATGVLLVALLPVKIVGPEIGRPWDILLTAGSLLFSYFMVHFAIGELGAAYRHMGETLERTREEIYEEARARSQALESIGAKVAHELKNPLAAIKGLVQLTSRAACNDPRATERFEVITREIGRMETILRDYLSFSRPLEDIRPEPFALARVVDDVLEVLEAHARMGGVTIARSGDAGSIVGDPRRLREALMNLVANAVDATSEGGRITVALSSDDAGATLRVIDEGRGMTDEQLARVGTPFFTTRDGGTGLGVVLAKATVAQHGGEVRYESRAGKGTTVTVRLPRRCPVSNAAAAE
jgi:signal transduction histidine kinase